MTMTPVRNDDADDDCGLTIADAAKWAGRSEAWVRTWRTSGPLEAIDVDGKQGVTMRSLRAFTVKRPRHRRRPVLRLVVDNTKS